MRKRFEQAQELDAELIPDIKLDSRSRHQLPKLLAGLQYIFITPDLNESVFKILEEEILVGRNKMGCLGMSLWEILVLGAVRLNLNTDYDTLGYQANNDRSLRGIMGVRTKLIFNDKGKYYPLQTIKDNVALLDEHCLERINKEVVKAGHKLKKKEEQVEIDLKLKTDSYPVESNIHFPTDINLLWDSLRKCLAVTRSINSVVSVSGCRKIDYLCKKGKRLYRKTSNIHQRKGANYHSRLRDATTDYLKFCKKIESKMTEILTLILVSNEWKIWVLSEQLKYYKQMLSKHIDLLERRIIKGEAIPHCEKVFSIFEPHVEWINKGKHHNKIDIGHNVLVTTDQFHFIIDYKVMMAESDSAQPIQLAQRLKNNFKDNYSFHSISFDRGFYSALSKKALEKVFKLVFMPRKGAKGKPNKKENRELVILANKHSAVESNINELEHSGADKVPDKGLSGFKKYVGLAVLAYNIKRLGRIVIDKKLINFDDRSKRKLLKAA